MPPAQPRAGTRPRTARKRFHAQDLRADVNTYSGDVEPSALRRLGVEFACVLNWHSELVLAQAGGDVWMGFGKYVRIDAKRNARAFLERGSARSQYRQLTFALNVKQKDTRG